MDELLFHYNTAMADYDSTRIRSRDVACMGNPHAPGEIDGGLRMSESMRIMSEKPLNAETPKQFLRSWITANKVFFDRNQGEIPEKPIELAEWRLTIDGLVKKPLSIGLETLLTMPKTIVANTLECSGNSRSLLTEQASGNPWTVGGVGNAVWGGVWLKSLLDEAGVSADAHDVTFEGFDRPIGKAQIKFIRSIPLEKALSTTLLAYEMNGEPLPLKHGFPLQPWHLAGPEPTALNG